MSKAREANTVAPLCDYPLRSAAPTKNKDILRWVERMEALLQPDRVHWVDGSEEEAAAMMDMMVKRGDCIKLNEELRPNSHLFRSDPRDVARVESRTFILFLSLKMMQALPITGWPQSK